MKRLPDYYFISNRYAAKQTVVNEAQARHLVQLIRYLEKCLIEHFKVRSAGDMPYERFEEIFDQAPYFLFIEGAYACGFVFRDGKPENPLVETGDRPEVQIASWTFPTLRQYIHFLLRNERWADAQASPVLLALISGHLQQVAARLESDSTLYANDF